MNEFEATVCGVHFRDDADVPYSTATTATAEEDEIAFAHVGNTGNGGTLGVLTARRTGEREVVLTINVAGETTAIETIGAALSAAIGNADEAESSVEQVFDHAEAAACALFGGCEGFGNTGGCSFAIMGDGSDELDEGLGAGFGESGLCGQRITGGSRLIVGYVLCIARLCAVDVGGHKPPGEQRGCAENNFFGFHEYLILWGD